LIENAEATYIWFVRIGDDVERDFFETEDGEGSEFRSCERPGHLTFGIGRLAGASDDEQETAGAKKCNDILDRWRAKGGRQDLERIGFENKIEIAAPMGGRFKQIGSAIFDSGFGEALSGGANGGFRNVESGGLKSPRGKLLGVIAKAAADDQCRFSGGLLRMRNPETDERRIGTVVRPGHDALPCFGFAVERFEPAGGIALEVKFRGELARSCSVLHFQRSYLAQRRLRYSNRGATKKQGEARANRIVDMLNEWGTRGGKNDW
jgi:hypothetical protein